MFPNLFKKLFLGATSSWWIGYSYSWGFGLWQARIFPSGSRGVLGEKVVSKSN